MAVATTRAEATVDRLDVSAYRVPTASPESDGTIEWDSTTMVVVEARSGDTWGIGYSYADVASATVIDSQLRSLVEGSDAFSLRRTFDAMLAAVRNLGRPGVASHAISAVDTALWDLKARLLEVPLAGLIGAARSGVPVYGSGGFTSYSIEQLQDQLVEWVKEGISRVKMKVGREPDADVERVRAARDAIGADVELMVDANGAYSVKQALDKATAFDDVGITWFEEPVSSDDLGGLRLVRERAPAGMEVAAGEYGYDVWYFEDMAGAGAVDVLQADATRCGGVTGFLDAAVVADAHHLEVSAHTAPWLHAHPAACVGSLRHVEYFYDHVRIERAFFDGIELPVDGVLYPDLSRPGMGIELKRADAQRYYVYGAN